MPGFYEVFFGPENREVTYKLLRYSALMVAFPVAVFYFLYVIVYKEDKKMLEWSGLGAVVAANLVVAAYVVMAWSEDKGEEGDTEGEPLLGKKTS